MEWFRQRGNTKTNGHVLFISIVGVLCLLYLGTTRTTEDQRLIDALMKYCYTHYALIKRPTPKNERRFLRYEAKLAQLSEGKFDHLEAEEVRAFLEPRGYAYEVEEEDGRVDYLLAGFTEHGHFEASGSDSLSYDYFLLDRIHVWPYDLYYYDDYEKEEDWSPLVIRSQNGCVYVHVAWVRCLFEELFTRLWESKVTRVSKMKGRTSHKILYRGVEEIWRKTRLYYRSEKAAKEHFVEQALESSVPVILGCVSRERYFGKQGVNTQLALELSYLGSLAEDPSFITLGLLCYLNEVMGQAWARNVIFRLKANGLGELGFENCSLDQIRWAAGRAFRLKREDLV